jgi:protein arginine kinase activator
MSCDQCREREAVIHLTQIVNEQVTTLHLCERCAAEKGVEAPAGSQDAARHPAAMGKGTDSCRPGARATSAPLRRPFQSSARPAGSAAPTLPRLQGRCRDLLRRLHGSTHHLASATPAGGAAAPWTESGGRPQEQLRLAVETGTSGWPPSCATACGAGMIDLSLLTDGGVGWLDAAGRQPPVLSTRIRLAEPGRTLPGRNSGPSARTSCRRGGRAIVLLRRAKFRLDRLDRVDRQLL